MHAGITFIPSSYGRDHRWHPITRENFLKNFNYIFERERSGFRFVGSILSPISSAVEVEEVNLALISKKEKGASARLHLETAVKLISKRPDPDYRNAIKEAISAVESVCITIVGEKGDTLRSALKALDDKALIHPSLRESFIKMYGYTNSHGSVPMRPITHSD